MDKKSQPKTKHLSNKADLIFSLSQISGVNKKDSTKALNAILHSIQNALKENKKVSLSGFGVFEVLTRPARKGVNPKTRKPIQIPSKNFPKLRFSKAMKAAIA